MQQVNRGLRLQLTNAPGSAFVDGRIIEGIRELISSVIRDLVYFDSEISGQPHHDLGTSAGSPMPYSRCCAMPTRWFPRSTRTWWCAGAVIPSREKNTTTPRNAVTNWDCAASTSSPVAVPAR